jgi:hypothetical protein
MKTARTASTLAAAIERLRALPNNAGGDCGE